MFGSAMALSGCRLLMEEPARDRVFLKVRVFGLIPRRLAHRGSEWELQWSRCMKGPLVVAVLALSAATAACGGITNVMPTSPSATVSTNLALAPSPAPAPIPAPVTARQVITGTVRPVADGGPRCYFGLYACETYNFSLSHDGGVEVGLTWTGNERALMVQLYRADVGLLHEDLARRGAAPTITFSRPDLAAMDYQLRVVSMETGNAVPFTLTFRSLASCFFPSPCRWLAGFSTSARAFMPLLIGAPGGSPSWVVLPWTFGLVSTIALVPPV